jgi:hypothetical protein
VRSGARARAGAGASPPAYGERKRPVRPPEPESPGAAPRATARLAHTLPRACTACCAHTRRWTGSAPALQNCRRRSIAAHVPCRIPPSRRAGACAGSCGRGSWCVRCRGECASHSLCAGCEAMGPRGASRRDRGGVYGSAEPDMTPCAIFCCVLRACMRAVGLPQKHRSAARGGRGLSNGRAGTGKSAVLSRAATRTISSTRPSGSEPSAPQTLHAVRSASHTPASLARFAACMAY